VIEFVTKFSAQSGDEKSWDPHGLAASPQVGDELADEVQPKAFPCKTQSRDQRLHVEIFVKTFRTGGDFHTTFLCNKAKSNALSLPNEITFGAFGRSTRRIMAKLVLTLFSA